MDTIERTSSGITFGERFPLMQRVILFCFGLLPLVAPYELLVVPSWERGAVLFAVIPVALSIGALLVSGLFLFGALFGVEQRIAFDAGLRSIILWSRPGLAGLREHRFPFGTVERIEIRTHEWSEGPASHNLVVVIARGTEIEFGRFGTKEEADAHLREVAGVLGLSQTH